MKLIERIFFIQRNWNIKIQFEYSIIQIYFTYSNNCFFGKKKLIEWMCFYSKKLNYFNIKIKFNKILSLLKEQFFKRNCFLNGTLQSNIINFEKFEDVG